MSKPAVFWDRDGTLIKDPGYLSDPEKVELLPGAAEALRRLAAAGFENIVASNQSGVARGLFDEATVVKINERLGQRLAEGGAAVDAFYYCPYLDGPEAVVEAYRQDSDRRKPKPGMLVKASLERQIDLAASWSVGDSLRDAEAGRAAGCRTILVSELGKLEGVGRNGAVDFVARSLADAADIVLRHTRRAAAPSPTQFATGTEAILQEILSFLRMIDKRRQAEEFSLTRLAGAMAQFAALGALVWAFFAMTDEYGVQIVRLLYALILQLIAITLFMLSRKK